MAAISPCVGLPGANTALPYIKQNGPEKHIRAINKWHVFHIDIMSI